MLCDGCTINGVNIDEVIVERCVCSYNAGFNENCSTNSLISEWLIHAAIFKSGDENYLLVSPNYDSSVIDIIIDPESGFNFGTVLLTESQYNYFVKKMSLLGNNILYEKPPLFDSFINSLVSIIPIRVNFEIMYGRCGIFDWYHNIITVAKNQSYIGILFSLIHEFVHFLTHDKNRNGYPKTIREYFRDDEEILCNSVASIVVMHFFKDFVMNKFSEIKNISTENKSDLLEIFDDNIIETLFSEIFFEKEEKVKTIAEDIINQIDKKIISKDYVDINFKRSDLVKLSESDDGKLCRLIREEISLLIPEEDEFGDDMIF